MQRQSGFSYQCLRCSRCCHDQAIQVNPYEILCLARHLGLSTGQFIAQHTTNQGLFLRFTDQGACGFLTPQGCAAHPARPLVCRLYPLGREIDLREGESFCLLERHPQCPASVLASGMLQDYLDDQGAAPFLEAADRYLEVVLEMHRALGDNVLGGQDQPGPCAAEGVANPWLDVDGVLGPDRAEADPWAAMLRHQEALRQWARQVSKEDESA